LGAQERNLGRYENVAAAIHPGGKEFLPEGRRRHGNIEIAHARLVDPSALKAAHLRAGKFQRTMVNIARDPLEREHRYGRIDGHQHAAGLRYRNVMLWAAGKGDPGASGLRSGSWDASEYKIARMIDAAGAAADMKRETRSLCGDRGELVLTSILGDEMTFQETAIRIGQQPGAPRFWRAQAGVTRVAREFREALRILADEWFQAGLKSRSSAPLRSASEGSRPRA
jgi:hypothetical protein